MSQYNPPIGGGAGDVSKADIAQNVEQDGIIWVSGGTFYGKNARTNIVVASGLDAANVISTALTQVQAGIGTDSVNILIKAGNYPMTSGIVISGNGVRVFGERFYNGKTDLFADAITSKISGLVILAGHNQEFGNMEIDLVSGVYAGVAARGLAHVNIHDMNISAIDETVSGVFGIKLDFCSSCFVKQSELYALNDGIHLLNSSANHIEDIYSEAFGTLVKLTGIGSDSNYVEHIDATATTMLSGIVGIVSGAEKNVIHDIQSAYERPAVYLQALSGVNRNKISSIINTDISGIEVLNNSPNVNYIAAYYPDVGASQVPRFTIWVSGSLYNAIRNTDGVMMASGTNARAVFQTVLDTSQFGRGPILVKAGSYTFFSGLNIGGGTTMFGDSAGETTLGFSAASGQISGAIYVSGVRVHLRDFNVFGDSGVTRMFYITSAPTMDNIQVDNNDSSLNSGYAGIMIRGGGGPTLRNVSVNLYDNGIVLASGGHPVFPNATGVLIDGVSLGGNNTGILLDAAFGNHITNVLASAHTSGAVRLINGSANNLIENVSTVSTTSPGVVFN